MTHSSLQQLRELADNDQVLQLALDGAADASELQAIASQRGIALSSSEAEQWLAAGGSATSGLSLEELDAISEGLSLSDEDLDAIAAGETGGEAIMVGEAL